MIRNRAETDTKNPAGSWRPPKYLRDIIGQVYQEEKVEDLRTKYQNLLRENEKLKHKANEAAKYKGQVEVLVPQSQRLIKGIPGKVIDKELDFLYAQVE